MQFDLMKFLLCRAIADNADPDTPGADRVALVTSLLNMGLVQSAVLTSVIAAGQAPPPRALGAANVRSRSRWGRSAAPITSAAKVKVPSVRHMSDAKQIHDHLHEHKLRPMIHRETIPEIKTPRVLRQWPAADEDVDEGAEINVLLLVPEESGHGKAEPRGPNTR